MTYGGIIPSSLLNRLANRTSLKLQPATSPSIQLLTVEDFAAIAGFDLVCLVRIPGIHHNCLYLYILFAKISPPNRILVGN